MSDKQKEKAPPGFDKVAEKLVKPTKPADSKGSKGGKTRRKKK